MKNFSSRTRTNSRHNKTFVLQKQHIVTVIAVLIALFLLKPIFSVVSHVVTSPFYAVQHYIHNSSSALPTYIRDRAELAKTIQALQDEVDSYRGISDSLTYYKNENDELRALLSATSSPAVVAGVIARPPHMPYDTLLIDRGARDGVVAYAPVQFGSGRALGYVREVYAHQSLVTLFSSSQIETTAYIFGPDIFTTAYGEGGGVIRLSVPQGIEVNEGDLVVLPALDGGVLGSVDTVQSLPTEPEQHAYVTLGTPLQSIRLVRVGLQPLVPDYEVADIPELTDYEVSLLKVATPKASTPEEIATSSEEIIDETS